MHRIAILVIFTFMSSLKGNSQQLRGTVSDSEGKPIASASVSIENSSYGVITNLKGEYFFELEPGTYRIAYKNLGYQEQIIEVKIDAKTIVKHIVLQESVCESTYTSQGTRVGPGAQHMAHIFACRCNRER